MVRLLHKLPFLLTLFITIQAVGKPDMDSGKRYHIVCDQFPYGCVVDGSTTEENTVNTPLFYLSTATEDESTYWIIEEQEEGLYTIKNAATNKFITYDGIRMEFATDGEIRRYVDMTDAAGDNYSLWRFQEQDEGVYTIRNAGQTDHIWDVRVDSYVVGTYSMTSGGNSNQRFLLYDEDGNLVTEKATEIIPPVTSGIDVSSWLDATTESMNKWTTTGNWKYNTGDGGSHYNDNDGSYLVQPFIESWQESSWGPIADCTLSQTLTSLPAGKYTLHADMMAVRQSYWGYPDEPAINVELYAGDVAVPVATGNDPPQHFTLDFTLSKTSDVEIGMRAIDTNANWIAIDNIKLFFLGNEEELLTAEKAKVLADLTDYLDEEEAAEKMAEAGNTFEELEALRKSIASMPRVDPINKLATGLTINGHAISYSASTDLYLCPIPLSLFGANMEAVISYTPKAGCSNLYIDGNEVAPGDTYTFITVEGGENIQLSITDDKGNFISHPLTFTSLPVVRIYGSFNNDYSDGYIVVNEADSDTPAEMLNMKAKWRGGITNSSGKHKRNYHVKLKDAEGEKLEKKFFGLRKDNSWILESCQVDMARIRNRTLTDLWNDYSTPPYYISEEPKALTGTRGHFVELILNDEYRGIYCMTENMDRKQMKLKKYDEEAEETHGQLWKSKDWSFATMMGYSPDGGYQPKDYLSDPDENSEMWDSYEVKYPDFEDYGYKTDWSTLYDAVHFVCYATDEEFREHIAEYIDLPLVIDYYILQETILSTDNHGKNTFFAVYDKQADKKITLGVWDMDATCGQRWSDSYYHDDNLMNPEGDYATYIKTHEHGDYNLFKRLRDTDAKKFNIRVRQRYRDLRQGELDTEKFLNRFRTYLDEFKTAGSAQRESEKWSFDSDVAGIELNFDNEMDYLTSWITRRMNYLDNTRFNISELPKKGDANGDGETDIADVMAVVNYILKKAPSSFQEIAADANIDGEIDIADAMTIVNLILNKTAGARAAKKTPKNPY